MASSSTHFIPCKGLCVLRQYFFVRKWGEAVMLRILNCCLLEEDPPKKLLKVLEDNNVSITSKSPFSKDEVDKISNEPLESLDITALYKINQSIWDKRLNYPRNQLIEEIKANPDKELVDLMKTYASHELREKMVKYPDYELLDLMLFIKNKRNEVSHVKDNLTESQLDKRLREFGEMLKDGLDKAAVLYPCHNAEFMQLKVDIDDSILKIQEKIREKYDPTNPDHLKEIQKEMEEFCDQMHDFIREKSVAQLRILYDDLCRISPFDWLCQYGLVDPGVIMIMLKMDTEEGFHDQKSSHKCFIDQNEILDQKDPRGNDPKVIIISGDAGSGKTTLICWLLEKWQKHLTHEVLSFSSFPVVLYMEFRKHDHDNFDRYLQDLLPQQVSDFGFEHVKSAILSSSLILCDGFDERNPKSLKLFEEILEQKWNKFKVIVTTRPVNTKEVTQIVTRSKRQRLNLTILGLRDEDIKDLIPKLTNHLVQNVEERIEMIKGITSTYDSMPSVMKQILKTPLHFNLFSLIYIDCPDVREELTNETKLFTHLSNHRSDRLIEKLKLHDKREELLKFEKFYKEWSLKYYVQGKYEINKNDVQEFKQTCNEIHLDFDSMMSWYFNIKNTRKGLKLEAIYTYRHRVEQEFAAAGAICDTITELYEENRIKFELLKWRINIIDHVFKCFNIDIAKKEKSDLQQMMGEINLKKRKKFAKEKSNLHQIMKFVTGILFTCNKGLLHSVVKDIFHHCEELCSIDQPLLDHILQTDGDEKVVEAFAEVMGNSLHEEGLRVGGKHLSCILPLVSKIQPKKITFDLSSENDPHNIPHLVQALNESAKKNIEIDIIANFYCDTVFPEKYLDAATTCVKFNGRLNARGIKAIPTRIKNPFLYMQLQDLPHLAEKVPDLVHLNELVLRLEDDGSFPHEKLSPVPWNGNFQVILTQASDVSGLCRTERLINLLNTLWPTSMKTSTLRRSLRKLRSAFWQTTSSLTLRSDASKFTGDDIHQILDKLVIQPLDDVTIWFVSDDAQERREELQSICKERGLGYLEI